MDHEERFEQYLEDGRIVPSTQLFKIPLFFDRAEKSLLLAKEQKEEESMRLHRSYWAITITYYAMLYAAKAAILSRGYEVKDHRAAEAAIDHLLVTRGLEKEDLQLLDEAHKIFEEEYVAYFEEARKESHIARYTAIKRYTERRVEEIFKNAVTFIAKIRLLLD